MIRRRSSILPAAVLLVKSVGAEIEEASMGTAQVSGRVFASSRRALRRAKRRMAVVRRPLAGALAAVLVSVSLVATAVPALAAPGGRHNLISAVGAASTAAGTATFLNPLDGQVVDSTKPFTWSKVATAQGYYLVVGVTQYGGDLVKSGVLPPSQASFNVPDLPTGKLLHATLLTEVNGTWTTFQAVTFTAAVGHATLTYPVDGQHDVSATGAFTWTTIGGGQAYYLAVGTTLYGTDLVTSGALPAVQASFRVSGLPTGKTLYATLLTEVNGAWTRFQSVTFVSGPPRATFTYPTTGEKNVSTAKPFTWSTAPGAQGYFLAVGAQPYGTELVNSGVLAPAQTSFTMPGLVTGKTLYATLLTEFNGTWTRYQAISFTTALETAHGSMDPSFGTQGQVTVAPSGSTPFSLAYVASTGQTLVAFYGPGISGVEGSFIERLSSSGEVDTTFGSGGRATMPASMQPSQVLDAGGGAVMVVGVPTAGTGQPGTVLLRLTAAGALDTGFGTKGVVTADFGAPWSPRKGVIGSDGRIFVGALVKTGASTWEIGLAAFTSTGTPDTSFGTAGIASTTLGGTAGGLGLALQPDGNLVLASGVQLPGTTQSEAVVARFLPTGQPDLAFASNGLFIKLLGGNGDQLDSVAVAPNGNLVVAGAQFTSPSGATPRTGIIAELTAQGRLNTSFGSSGTIVENPFGDALNFLNVAVGADSKIYGLLMEHDGPFNCSLRRYTSDGKPDTTFGSSGVVSLTNTVPMDLVLAFHGRPELALEIPNSAAVITTRFVT